jgi:hypothetical protein
MQLISPIDCELRVSQCRVSEKGLDICKLHYRLGTVHFTIYVDSAPLPLAEVDDALFSVTGVTVAAVGALLLSVLRRQGCVIRRTVTR